MPHCYPILPQPFRGVPLQYVQLTEIPNKCIITCSNTLYCNTKIKYFVASSRQNFGSKQKNKDTFRLKFLVTLYEPNVKNDLRKSAEVSLTKNKKQRFPDTRKTTALTPLTSRSFGSHPSTSNLQVFQLRNNT